MSDPRTIQKVLLGPPLGLEQLVAVARYGAAVEFSPDYQARVRRSRELVERLVAEGRVVYGTTTGFGNLCDRVISEEEAAQLQLNLVRSDAASVGRPLTREQTRAVILMMLQNTGRGFSGIRLETLELLRQFLNRDLIPFAPREGSVGYLTVEANIALVLLGEGKAFWKGSLLDAGQALEQAGLSPTSLSYKEGLALLDGTTSATALGALALFDMIQAAKSADVIGALSVEALKGLIRHFDPRVSQVRPHPTQRDTADNLRRLLAGSQVIEEAKGSHLQDALSLRCIPQLHGAAKKLLYDARETFEVELNSCTDNPILWDDGDQAEAISACNSDSAFVGMSIDACCIAATGIARMSERRNNRLVDGNLSGYSWFLVKNPGLNCGLMVPQYSQAGLINDMKILSHPATVDGVPTCGNQEDYVAMGYNAGKKAIQVAEKLEYTLAIELLSCYEAQGFMGTDAARSPVSRQVYQEIGRHVPVIENDFYLYPHMEYLRDLIHSGELLAIAERIVGGLK